ncbi:MAG: hypothetical protein LBU79_05035 [Planctomycetota bacterium]|jgi:carboxyl-terminal processing protease|nr:hypothetical protein [Planctomycetota bacterium]
MTRLASHLFCLSFLLFLTFLPSARAASRPTAEEQLAALPDGEPVWTSTSALKYLAENSPQELADRALSPTGRPVERLAAATALLEAGEQREGTLGLEILVLDPAVALDRRLEAAQVLGKWGGEYSSAKLGTLMTNTDLPERLRVELAYSLWKLTSRPQAYEVLEDIQQQGASSLARTEALLALAQTDRFYSLRDQVKEAANLPGPLGERAKNIILINSRLDEETRRDDFTVRLISEVVEKIRDYYAVDDTDTNQAKRLQPKSLAESGAQAVLYSLDQFNDYLNEEDFAEFDAQLKANYGGIGAWVGVRDKRFTILTPMYEKPAYKAGLRPMDVIDRVNEVDVTDMRQNDIVKLLKGEPNSIVKLRVYRRSWKEPRTIDVKREIIQIESVLWQTLPGDIGYIKINSFNEGDSFRRIKSTANLVRDALSEFNRLGIKGIILDMANNPGGVLISGVDVAKLFIGEGKVIVSSRGRRNDHRSTLYKAGLGRPFYRNPLVVVVNGGTASAAEIVSGAIRDHNRGQLVGRRTFGKGSVQSLMGVDTTRDRSRIKLTVAKYYLPNGETIHEKGIDPDRKIPESELSVSEAEARWKIRDQHDVQFWLEENSRFERFEDDYRRLLVFDNYDSASYPEFDSFYNAMVEKYPKEKIDRELVRKEIRYGIASYLRDYRGEKQYVDLEDNPSLQEAVVTLGDSIGGLPDNPFFASIRQSVMENRTRVAEEEGDLAEGR